MKNKTKFFFVFFFNFFKKYVVIDLFISIAQQKLLGNDVEVLSFQCIKIYSAKSRQNLLFSFLFSSFSLKK